MSAPIIAAGISAGASLLGGLFNRSENRRRERRADPASVRKRFEAAGFNPLLGVGAMNAPINYGPTMGDAVMNAGSLAMSAYNQTDQLEIQRAELEMANERLTQLAEEARLRPTYPGPYQVGADARPRNNSQDMAADDTSGGDSGSSDLGTSVTRLAPGRELDVLPATTSPGIFEMNNDITGPLVLPGDGEPWGIDELLTAVTIGAPQVVFREAREAREEFDRRRPVTYRDYDQSSETRKYDVWNAQQGYPSPYRRP